MSMLQLSISEVIKLFCNSHLFNLSSNPPTRESDLLLGTNMLLTASAILSKLKYELYKHVVSTLLIFLQSRLLSPTLQN